MGSFEGIYHELQALLNDPNASMKVKGDAFELAVQWLLLNDPTYGLVDGDVRLWDEAPVGKDSEGRPWRWHSPDTGTDLLAYPKGGRKGSMVAVQAKSWSRNHTVAKEEVNSFLADSNRPEVASRIFATTSDNLNSKALATLTGQEKPVTLVTFGTLMEAPVTWPVSLKALKKELRSPKKAAKRKAKPLRPYQRKVVNDAVTFFQGGGTRGKVIMACGTGKTLTAQRLAEALEPDRVLVLFPSLMLLKQTLQQWLIDAGPKTGGFDWIAVCSDDTVAAKRQDHPVSRVADLGLPNVTTDPDHIQTFLKGANGGKRRVVFATFQSSPQIATAMTGTRLKFDLMVCDEAHRMARVTKTSGKAAARDPFTTGLDDKLIPAEKRMFLTATPKVYGEAVKKKAADTDQEALVASMDNEDLFGPTIAMYTFKQAIDGVGSNTGPVLADYKVLAVVVTEDEIESMLANRSYVALTTADGSTVDVTDTQTLATQIAVLKAMEHPTYGITGLISYHHTIKRAEQFQASHNQYRAALELEPIATNVVRGSDPADKRPDKLQILSASKQPGAPKALVSNARCLTEGIDVPLLDGVAFVDPKGSLVDIVQAVGRAIRRPPDSGKETGYVIVPIYLTTELLATLKSTQEQLEADGQVDHVFADAILDPTTLQGLDRELNRAFKPVIEVLRNLRSMDDTLTEIIQKLKTERGARSIRTTDSSITGLADIETHLHLEILEAGLGLSAPSGDRAEHATLGKTSIDLKAVHDAIHLVTINAVLDGTVEDWWERRGTLASFVKVNGRYPLRDTPDPTEGGLARWIEVQRSSYQSGRMPQERSESLTALPDWTWSVTEDAWQEKFTHLAAFHQRELRYPSQSADDPAERSLGIWASNQRSRYRRGSLTVARTQALESLPNWLWEPLDDRWRENLESWADFRSTNGRQPSSTAPTTAERKLGAWALGQRTAHRNGKLSPERASALESLPGWKWTEQSDAWTTAVDELSDFVRLHGRLPSQVAQDALERRLGKWVVRQRTFRRKGSLTPEQVAQLEQVPGWTWHARAVWEKTLQELAEFVSTHDRFPRADPETGELESKLHRWVISQRMAHKKSGLSDGRIHALETIPGWKWSERDDRWPAALQNLRAFLDEHLRYPSNSSTDDAEVLLAKWVQRQRTQNRKGTLTPNQQAQLASLRDWVWDVHTDVWVEMLSELERFVSTHDRYPSRKMGPESEQRLGAWVSTQRQRYQASKLSSDRIKALQNVPGWRWDAQDAAWESNFGDLKAFIEKLQRYPVARTTEEPERRLGSWVHHQRVNHKRGKLSAEKARRLEALPNWRWAGRRETPQGIPGVSISPRAGSPAVHSTP